MISLILPYWDRQEAADKAIASIAVYEGVEVIVVDDGNPIPFKGPGWVKVVRLPEKAGPTSPVRAWNEGVKASTGDMVCLSCIEVLHPEPVLYQMAEELERIGPNGYVLAAAFCPDSGEWHCHSTFRASGAPEIPPGTGRGFCGLMYRELFDRVGGFDEAYMSGVGYEDMDFIHRLLKAEAKFKVRDDLVVIHPKAGATIRWPSGWFETNRKLYDSRWA